MQWDLIDSVNFRIDNEFEVCYLIEMENGVSNMQPYIWFLIGFPGVGKSTYRKEFFEKHIENPVILSTDDLIEDVARHRGLTYNDVFKETIGEATDYFFDALEKSLADDKSVVIDRTNLTKKSRKRILNMVPDHYKKIAVVVYCNEEVQKERLAERKGKHIPSHVIESMIKTYDNPIPQEGFDSITYVCTDQKDSNID